MTAKSNVLLKEALELSFEEKTELTDRLVENLAAVIPNEIVSAQIQEAQSRLQAIRSGKVKTVPGDKALKAIRSRFSE